MGEKETLTLSVQHLATPPPHELPFDLHHLLDGAETYTQPRQNTTSYASPKMEHEAYAQHYGQVRYPEPPQSMGLGIQYLGYEQPHHGYHIGDGRHSHTSSPFIGNIAMPSPGPPTPRSLHSDTGRRTRSGRSTGRTVSPQGSTRKSTPPRSKKQKANKEKTKTPKLTAPLSVLTRDMNVELRDMEIWVHRSAEDRAKEAEKRNGYVTRPMNSFMLYRSAYAERTKAWCVHNNHQVVSSVSGESWPLEPLEVREFYNELSRIERLNHSLAHPDYKFSPSKPGAAAKKRKGNETEDDSEPSDLDDPDADWGSSNKSKAKSAKRPGRDAGYPARANLTQQQHNPHGGYDDNFGPGDGYNKSSWEANNNGRPIPQHMIHQNVYGQHYYQTHIPANSHMMAGVEDIRYAPMELPGYASNQPLIGLPGGSHHDLMAMHSGSPRPMMEPQVDPMLLAFDDQHHSMGMHIGDGLTLTQHAQYEPSFASEFDAYTAGPPGPLITNYHTKQWEPESVSPTFEQPGEFEKMWSEHEHAQLERPADARSAKSEPEER